jgi:hypothetical protein
VTRSRTPRELRDRMERVAAKPHQPPQSASKRRTAPRADVVGARPAPELSAARPRSRLDTLAAWGKWELTVVPARRWRWLRAVISPDNSPTDDRRRDD